MYASKHTIVTGNTPIDDNTVTVRSNVVGTEITTHKCPFCGSLSFSEYVKPSVETHTVDVVSTPYENVKSYINKGYEVHTIYAKAVTLIKTENKEVKQE